MISAHFEPLVARARALPAVVRSEQLWVTVAVVAFGLRLVRSGIFKFPGLHDNDWPLLMWLAKHGSLPDPAPLTLGHYGFAQLVLVSFIHPLFHNTAIAAKALNILATMAAGLGVFRIVRASTRTRVPAWLALVLFFTSAEVYLTGQSEFGDPIPTALFAWGLVLLLEKRSARWALLAGVLWGAGACFRVHFQFFALAAALAAGGYLHTRREDLIGRWWVAAGAVLGGVLLGEAPMMGLNLWVHGGLGSPIASALIGQALFGANDYDMANTYANFPLTAVLADHKLQLVQRIAERLLGAPLQWVVALGVGVLSLPRRDSLQSRRALVCLLALGYYVGFVTPSWGLTYRLLLPIALLASVAAAAGAEALALLSSRRLVHSAALAAVIAAWGFYKLPQDRSAVEGQLRGYTGPVWSISEGLTAVLRAHGLREPREAFVFDWNRFLTDDPELVTFYNFGFWNLLVPSFAAERPNPWPTVGDVHRFAAFMHEQRVRFVVMPRVPGPPFSAFAPVADGKVPLDGFEMIPADGPDVVFAATP